MQHQVQKLAIIIDENALEMIDFANCLGISERKAQAICSGEKPLSATLARQIEQTFFKPYRWLDIEESDTSEGPSNDLFG
ncbi:hypothetical protein [Reinekea blandensis]|uniref:XRE family transcriptional regulator n=1 Tax=Reinekea blandensis MED297 TaxID=314283 RepID=A4BE18_9GAMM|nr:hypothetical protein [Reinekea blandensis]EAR09777.1 hypothetical protein MED297_16499 [Reinekea blandensis MED297]